jgi:ABC-2 type transport system permease protein
MRTLRQFVDLLRLELLMARDLIWMMAMVQFVMTLGLILGFGYFIPNMTDIQALFLTTGAASQTVVTTALVILPQKLAQDKAEGKLTYLLTLPIPRETYVLVQIAFVALATVPGTAFAVAFGAWHYDISLAVSATVLAVVPLAIFSLAGIGVAIAILSPYPQLTNALTQLTIFYVLLFAPVMFPKDQLPELLQKVSVVMPPTYVADAMRAALTDLPGTHLGRSILVMAAFAVGSIALSAITVRRRG